MRPSSLLAPIALAALAALEGCAVRIGGSGGDVWVEETEQFDLPAGDLQELAIRARNGAITVRAGEPGARSVRVTVMKSAGGDDEADAREALVCLDVVRRAQGSTLELAEEWTREPDRGWGARVSFEVVVPAGFGARLESRNGSITVEGLSGALEVLSHNGRLQLDASSPRVRASTHNGAVEFRGSAGQIELETRNGWVKAELTGGAVSGRIGTRNGGVVVTAAPSVRGTVEGETRNGSVAIHAANAGCTIREKWFRVEFGDPSAGRLEVSTRNGSIELR